MFDLSINFIKSPFSHFSIINCAYNNIWVILYTAVILDDFLLTLLNFNPNVYTLIHSL